jgi:hypothetical protein
MTTIRIIAKGIKAGALYQPIRHLAGRITKTAPPKHYVEQIKAIYNAILTQLWHYTYDPKGAEFLTTEPEQMFELTLGGGHSDRRGYGDCDDIAQSSGALLRSIGMDVLIATTVREGSPHIFDHVFLFVKPPNSPDWIPFDPVLPSYNNKKGFGDIVSYKRLALWSLDGQLVQKIGPFPPKFDSVMRAYGRRQLSGAFKTLTGAEKAKKMPSNFQPSYFDFQDYSGYLGADEEIKPNPVSGRYKLNPEIFPDFQIHGVIGFGMYNEEMGYTTGAAVPHIMAEVDESDMIGNTGLVRTKHFELDPADYAHIIATGAPKMGSLAMADDGEIYEWQSNPDGMGGLFKKLARRIKKRVKKIGRKISKKAKGIARRVKKFAKKVGGTKLFRLGKRLIKTGLKYVKPLLKKYGGKIMQAVAPIAGLVPGAGPFLSTALVVGGKAYDIAQKAKVVIDKFGKPLFKSLKQAKSFKGMLKDAARQIGKQGAKQILSKYAASKGLSGADEPLLMAQGSKWRTVNTPGYGWCS